MKRLLITLAIATSLLMPGISSAQTDSTATVMRPVYAAYTVNAGTSHRADTYLSPVKYEGWAIGFGYQRRQAMKFNPTDWLINLQLDLDIGRTKNPTGNAIMWYAGIDVSWGMLHRWKLTESFSVGAGPSIAVNGGCLYLDRNGNNPASAKAAITLNASVYGAWNGSILNLPVTIRYQAFSPLTGIFFAPDYGELYYEIYLGNHSGLARCGWWGNYFRYDHQLTADLHLGATWLRIGYRGNIFSTKASHIVTRDISHCAVIGLSGEWISVDSGRKLSSETRMITATY